MSETTDYFNSLAAEALSLSARERGDLAGRLLRSLEKDPPLTEEEQLAIVYDRVRQFEVGQVNARPVEEVMQELREKYGL